MRGDSMFPTPGAFSLGKAFRALAGAFALAALFSPLCAWSQDGPQMNLQRVKLSAGMHLIDAQVALTPEQRLAQVPASRKKYLVYGGVGVAAIVLGVVIAIATRPAKTPPA